MVRSVIVVALLAFATGATFAQASSPEGASAPAKKHKLAQKYKAAKAHHPPASATNPEAMPDKKGGN